MNLLPQWIKVVFTTVILGSLSWALQDRLALGERIATMQEWAKHLDHRLDRIENKLDKVLETEKK